MLPLAVSLLLVVPIWFLGGLGPAGRVCLAPLCALVWGVMFAKGRLRAIHKDVVFWIVLAFLAVLTAQHINSGRELRYYINLGTYCHAPARYAWLPSAVHFQDSHKVALWFFAAWTAIMAARHGLTLAWRRRAMMLAVQNSWIVVLVGAGVALQNSHYVMGFFATNEPFFGPFGYVNMFTDYALLICGMAWYLGGRWRWGALPVVVAAPFAGMPVVGATCVAGVLLLGVFAAVVALSMLPRKPGMRRVAVTACAALTLVALTVAWRGRERLVHELSETRMWQAKSAVAICADNKLFGTGAGGYKSLAPFYVDAKYRRALLEPGRANIHNDYAQYLMELGLVGCGLLALAVGAMLHNRREPEWWLLLGLALVGVHAFVDLPFRCPALLIMAGFILGQPREAEQVKGWRLA